MSQRAWRLACCARGMTYAGPMFVGIHRVAELTSRPMSDKYPLDLLATLIQIILKESEIMTRSTISFSSRGQVVIPRALRRELGIEEGTRALVESQNGAIIMTPITREYVKSQYGRYRGKNLLGSLAKEKHREKDR